MFTVFGRFWENIMSITIEMPENLNKLLDRLESAGYEAYAVGGCVRDSLLGRKPLDWDVATNARPEQVKELFRHTVDTGLKHGTVTVLMDKGDGSKGDSSAKTKPQWESYEVTTFRKDGDYSDGRHPDSVEYAEDLKEDLLRRDFTINAMAYNRKHGLVDCYHGQEDLKAGVIRAVGEPIERFREDALRMLRAIRFASQLGFSIEHKTREAIKTLSDRLSMVSQERIQTELCKTLRGRHPEALRDAWELGLTSVFLPEFDRMMETEQNTPHHSFNVGEHTLRALRAYAVSKSVQDQNGLSLFGKPKAERPEQAPVCGEKELSEDVRERVVCLSILLHDVGKPVSKTTDQNGRDHFHGHAHAGAKIAKAILKRLKFDNKTIELVTKLVEHHEFRTPLSDKAIRHLMVGVGNENMEMLMSLRSADIFAQSDYQREEKMSGLVDFWEQVMRIRKGKNPLSISELSIRGADLVEMGIPEGPEIGRILNRLLEEVLEAPGKNTRDYLLQSARRYYTH